MGRKSRICLISVLLTLIISFIILQIIRIYCCDVFTVRGDSMYPTLLDGDRVMVDKKIIGARLYKDLSAITQSNPPTYRKKGKRNVKRNDVIAYNHNDYKGKKWPVMEFVVNNVFCKRVLAIPGDTISIINGYYRCAGVDSIIGYEPTQEQLNLLGKHSVFALEKTFPDTSWTMYNAGPLYIPKKGDEIMVTEKLLPLYAGIIAHETGEDLMDLDAPPFLYRFKKDYYFVGGDYLFNSIDSRYFGLIPEDFILGIITKVLYSYNSSTKVFIEDRYFLTNF